VLQAESGTNYSAAFKELREVLEADRRRFTESETLYELHRAAVYFLTDGEPNEGDAWKAVFRDKLTYDRATGRGFKYHPIVFSFGFRDATEDVMKSIAYPPERGRWYVSGTPDIKRLLSDIIGAITSSIQASDDGGRVVAPELSSDDVVSGDAPYDSELQT
jgi:uncharacterized protein YegL